jgi:hypothetical protein
MVKSPKKERKGEESTQTPPMGPAECKEKDVTPEVAGK